MGMINPNNGSSSGLWWNYTKRDKDNFSLKLEGDVVLIETPQATQYPSNAKVWMEKHPVSGQWRKVIESELDPRTKEGDRFPLFDVRLTIATADDKLIKWQFKPGSTKHPSEVIQQIAIALNHDPKDDFNITELGGKHVVFSTEDGTYGLNTPRPWHCEIKGEGTHPFQGLRDMATVQRMDTAQEGSAQTNEDAGGNEDPGVYDADVPF